MLTPTRSGMERVRRRRSARRLGLAVAFASALLPLGALAQSIPCPEGAPAPASANYVVEVFDLTFCWPALSGSPTYRVETSTNDAAWIQEAVVSENRVTLRRGLGDQVRVRVTACQGSACGSPSGSSKRTFVLRDYDADHSGKVSTTDFSLLRSLMSSPIELLLFQKVYGYWIVGQRYLPEPPS